MNSSDLCFSWTREQWAWAADYALTRGEKLPPDSEPVRALEVQEVWYFHRTDEPGPSLILGTDVLGRELPPRHPQPEAGRWARRMFAYAKQEAMRAQITSLRPGRDWTLTP